MPALAPDAALSLPADAPLPGAAPVASVVRANWRLFVGVPLLFAFVGALIALFTPVTYTSTASFMPTTASRSGGGLASLGAQFGLTLPGDDPSQSPAFYVDLLQSEVILRQLLQREYQLSPSSPRRPLAELYGVNGATGPEREYYALKKLRKEITPSASQKTGVIRLNVRARSAYLARQVAVELLGAVDRFNNERRKTSARAERQFTEERLRTITDQLRRAEEQLAEFRARNVEYGTASRLRLEEARLDRSVALYTQLQVSLSQAYEQARIDEVRNTPLISPVEAPSLPVRRDSRGLVRLVLTGGVLGLMLALAVSLSRRALAPVPPRALPYA